MSKKFTGIRRRVEGERARFAVVKVVEQGFLVSTHDRLANDTGYFIRTKEGPAINLYDTGTITVTGNNRHLLGDTDDLRMPNSVNGVQIVATHDDDALLRLSMNLQVMGLPVNTAFFSQPSWMKQVALARRRGMHILAFISAGNEILEDNEQPIVQIDACFGLGLLIARIEREHLTVLWDQAIALPRVYGLLGPNLIQFDGNIEPDDPDIRSQLFQLGMVAHADSGALELLGA